MTKNIVIDNDNGNKNSIRSENKRSSSCDRNISNENIRRKKATRIQRHILKIQRIIIMTEIKIIITIRVLLIIKIMIKVI